MRRVTFLCASLFTIWSAALFGQTAVTTRSTNLRRDPSTQRARIRQLEANEQLSLLSSQLRNGYYHVETRDSTKGWVWARNVRTDTTTAANRQPDNLALSAVAIGPPVPGSNSLAGCGDGLWQHVYHPYRLLVMNECVTVSGTIVDATKGRNSDGVRHEADGDTHGWLQLDPQFANLLNSGNTSAENGNLVFEIVCHYRVTQADAVPACSAFGDHTAIPPVGTHVRITGAFVQDNNHAKWNEIHPVSRIVVIP
jgi:uncharacterized protein YgiM (DUF1202 family)